MTEKRMFGDEIRYGSLDEFGEPVLELEESVSADEELAAILEWPRVFEDDDGNPYELFGLVEDQGTSAVFSFSRNLAVGKDYSYRGAMVVTAEQNVALRRWIETRLAARAEVEQKEKRIESLLREHGLDDASIRAKREQLLRENGLL